MSVICCESYSTPILITLKGKSPSLTVKDDNNSGTTDLEEPDSGDIDDGDHGHNHETKTTQETNSKIRLVDRLNHPSSNKETFYHSSNHSFWNRYLKSSEYQRKESKD